MKIFFVIFFLILAFSLLLTGLLYLLRRRFTKTDRDRERLHPAVFSFFTTIYAFFLGFAIVTLWSAYLSAQTNTAREADSLLVAFRDSKTLDNSGALRQALTDYVKSVMADEWPAMAADNAMSEKTDRAWDKVWAAYMLLKPQNKMDNNIFLQVGKQLTQASQYRFSRSQSTQSNLYSPIWVIIVFGFITVLYGLYFHHLRQSSVSLIFDFMVIFVVLCCIYFIYDIDTPFSGYIVVKPSVFKVVYAKMLSLL
jgi:uncharacterized membrane protein YfcA